MSRKIIVLVAVCLVLILSAAVTLRSRSTESAPIRDDTKTAGEKLIAGYKQWTRVNPEPAMVQAQNAQLCAIAINRPQDPHKDKYITVYVNDIGRHAMMEEKTPHFPKGSVIVKEKLTTSDSTTPELLTVMIKRDRGYNPDSGDWEYMVVDGNGQSIQERGKLENCQSCHMMERNTDYVSRRYLPGEVAAKLK